MIREVVTSIAVLTVFAAAGLAQSDLQMRKKTEMILAGAQMPSEADIAKLPAAARERMRNLNKSEKTVRIKGSRTRTDFVFEKQSGPKMKKVQQTLIDQCDKRRTITFRDDEKKYTVNSYGDAQPARAVTGKSKRPPAARGSIDVTVTGTDTGERMKLFGLEARRIRQKITMTPNANSCMKLPMRVDIDGWYVDIPSYSCPLKPGSLIQADGGNCADEMNIEVKGVQVTGIPVKETKTIETGDSRITVQEEVVELIKTSLDPALFEAPTGYSPAGNSSPVADNTAEITPDYNPPADGPPSNIPAPALNPPPAGVAAAETLAGTKRAGIIRIGIAAPAADMGQDFTAGDTSQAVRNTIAVALKTDKVETVFLDSSLPAQEARQKQCDYIFYSKVTRKKGGGGLFGSMGPMLAGAAAGMIPGVGGIVASIATSAAITASTISGGFKSKDEVGFEYTLTNIDGTSLIPTTSSKQKAKKNGEDILTPQIQQAAAAVLSKTDKP